jgi:hypothetical protein
MASRKGQASVENIAMVSSFMVIMIPLIVFMLSISTTHSSDFYQKQLYEDTDVLKRNMEESYAFCPGNRTISIYYPAILDNVTFIKAGDRAMLLTNYTLDGNEYSFSTPVNVVNNNKDDYGDAIEIIPIALYSPLNFIQNGGIVRIRITCEIVDKGMDTQHILLGMEDARG